MKDAKMVTILIAYSIIQAYRDVMCETDLPYIPCYEISKTYVMLLTDYSFVNQS